MTIGDDGIASICMGKAHEGNPCERCGHTEDKRPDETPKVISTICGRHCSVCEGMDHHWMPGMAAEDEDGDTLDGEMVMVCKHCDAVREITDEDDEF